MKQRLSFLFGILLLASSHALAEPEFPLTADSKPQAGVPAGTMIKETYTATEGGVFPGTEREYQIYLPNGFDKTKPAPFMVFQDGVIYQAPVVFDNLIAKKEIPPLVGIFIKPGVVPAANDNALPRYNRSYEYDSVTPGYSRFLIEEFLPAIEKKHGLNLSTDGNDAAIAGNSSGGICAFMAAWHRPDRFRRVFTGVGTYVGIRGADQLPVLVRKMEPKPIRVFLQSGTGDNNLYCGDWWMANQMMERSLTWAGYDVNHAWGDGGHNQKHASQVFPDAMRWLWREWQTSKEIKANPRGESKWKGYEVVSQTYDWKENFRDEKAVPITWYVTPTKDGVVFAATEVRGKSEDQLDGYVLKISDSVTRVPFPRFSSNQSFVATGAKPMRLNHDAEGMFLADEKEIPLPLLHYEGYRGLALGQDGLVFISGHNMVKTLSLLETRPDMTGGFFDPYSKTEFGAMALSPDQTLLYASEHSEGKIWAFSINGRDRFKSAQPFVVLDSMFYKNVFAGGLCVDTEGRLYAATFTGIQVCDQAGRVNFIIPTPAQPYDVCFGGKDLSELFIACGNAIYKRPTKARGYISGQMAPIKPAPPKL